MSDQNLDIKENKFKSFFITNQKKIFFIDINSHYNFFWIFRI